MTVTEFAYYMSVTAFAVSVISMVAILIISTGQRLNQKKQASLTVEQYIHGLTLHLKKRFGTKKHSWFCSKHERRN